MELKRFDYKLKENKKKPIIITIVIVMILLVGVTIYATLAYYKTTNTYSILQGDVDFFEKRDITIAAKLVDSDGNVTTVEEFPNEGYTFDVEKSYCINGSIISYEDGEATVSKIVGKDKCTFYFRETYGKLAKAIMANSTILDTTPDFSTSATDSNTNLYKAEDDYGTSYYFRGASTNNYVKFGTYAEDTTLTVLDYKAGEQKNIAVLAGTSMYWRIVRINGDGTIRLVYDGTTAVENGTSHTATIANTVYNTKTDEEKYVGYTYDADGTEENSTIKGVVDKWYAANLEKNYGSYIADSIFCNDKEVTEADDYYTYYGAYTRLITNKNPKLTCTQSADKYTVSSDNGNGLLTYSVGLLTADEAVFAGGTYNLSNSTYYLYSNEMFWTSAPYYFDDSFIDNDGYAYVWYVYYDGSGDYNIVDIDYPGARPVINLKADVDFTGSGKFGDPYIIVTE